MRWIQDEKPVEHHLSGWHDYGYHHHETGKKKMLGGVSFDGGASAGTSKGHTASRTGVQTAQPSFSDMRELAVHNGLAGLDRHNGLTGRGASSSREGSGRGIKGISDGAKDTVSIQKTRADNALAQTAAAQEVMQTAWEASAQAAIAKQDVTPQQEKHRFTFDYKKYFGKLRGGIETFLKGMEQKAGKRDQEKPKKKEHRGTRAITKEEVYEIQANTAYLLDSYNKYGERSTLGKE